MAMLMTMLMTMLMIIQVIIIQLGILIILFYFLLFKNFRFQSPISKSDENVNNDVYIYYPTNMRTRYSPL